MPVDFGRNGFGVPSVFENITYVDGEFDSYVFNNNLAPFVPFDKSMTGDRIGGLSISNDAANPTTLFQLSFKISDSAVSGLYDVISQDFLPSPFTSFLSPGGAPIVPNVIFDQGQFQVASAAVPEPGTIGFGLGVMALAYLRRRRSAAVLKDPAA